MRSSISTPTRRWLGLGLAATVALGGSLLLAGPAFADASVTLTGQVTSNGVPVENVHVHVFHFDPTTGQPDGNDQHVAYTDASGNFSDTLTLSDGGWAFEFLDHPTDAAPYASQFETWDGKIDPNLSSPQFTVSPSGASQTNFGLSLVNNSGIVSVTLKDAVSGAVITNPASTSGSAAIYDGFDADGRTLDGSDNGESGTDFLGTIPVTALPGTYYSLSANADGYSTGFASGPLNVAAGQFVPVTISLSPSSQPTVYSVLPIPRVVSITGAPKIGALLTATYPASGATASFKWYADGVVIPGATAQTFSPTQAQLGKSISVQVLLQAAGYSPSILSNTVSTKPVQIGDPNTAVVHVAGTAKFGKTLTVSVTGGTVADAKSILQWYRAGAPVAGATGSSYVLTKADVGQAIFASVTSFAQGHTDAVIPSNTVTVAKDKVKVTFSAKTSISKSSKLKVKINITDGTTKNAATGTVKVYYSSKKFKTATFSSKTKTKTVTLPKLSKGKHTIKITYVGDTHYAAKSTSFKVKVK